MARHYTADGVQWAGQLIGRSLAAAPQQAVADRQRDASNKFRQGNLDARMIALRQAQDAADYKQYADSVTALQNEQKRGLDARQFSLDELQKIAARNDRARASASTAMETPEDKVAARVAPLDQLPIIAAGGAKRGEVHQGRIASQRAYAQEGAKTAGTRQRRVMEANGVDAAQPVVPPMLAPERRQWAPDEIPPRPAGPNKNTPQDVAIARSKQELSSFARKISGNDGTENPELQAKIRALLAESDPQKFLAGYAAITAAVAKPEVQDTL